MPEAIEPTKLLVTRHGAIDALQRALGDNWYVIKLGASMHARRFDLIICATLPRDDREKEWFDADVRTCLAIDGDLFYVGE